ncbi:hypothetical protein SEA_ZAGIE_41 [Microbacterium phage Zagie]|nr:hypothetical protein SEA_NAMAGO_42 [Microbacterium phage Namago]UJD20776.1 hypothetical protein SEA_ALUMINUMJESUS_40 [Microbacterium phage AluminumJesus]UVG34300.1 hypothetical protein SEA_GRASSBOY_43 [Microbacterium phage Grassboy]UVG34409.1 hypothetical protein SEA_GAZEBO_40 [Microbacterium phage Gazebo]UVG35394.1 hypothetical protein SEA_ZAGIE_41 [Microbacterium phage Zagie]WKW84909.1 membrane protein [Microbacterium phage SallyK]
MDWFIVAMFGFRVLAEVGGGGDGGGSPSLNVDLLDLQWWQVVVGLLGVVGFSPAPWILGLATNKLQFTSTADANYALRAQEMRENFDALAAEKDRAYAVLEATVTKTEQAGALDRQTAATATEALAESTEVTKMAIHVVQELRQAAQEVSPHVD